MDNAEMKSSPRQADQHMQACKSPIATSLDTLESHARSKPTGIAVMATALNLMVENTLFLNGFDFLTRMVKDAL